MSVLSDEARAGLQERWARIGRQADARLAALPLAGTTFQCPKCMFGHLPFLYTEREYLPRTNSFQRRSPHGSRPPGMGLPTRMLIVRTCPQCTAETHERPADSVAEYGGE